VPIAGEAESIVKENELVTDAAKSLAIDGAFAEEAKVGHRSDIASMSG
jgi:hypothetical protein